MPNRRNISAPDCLTCSFKHASFWKALNEEELKTFMSIRKGLSFGQREVIFREGNISHGIYILCSGSVVLTVSVLDESRDRFLKIIFPGAVINIEESLHADRHAVTAKSIKKSMVSFIHWIDFTRLLETNKHFNQKFMDNLGDEIKITRQENLLFSSRSAMQRLANLLLYLGEKAGHSQPEGLVIDCELKRNEVADLIGITHESVTRMLFILKDQGLIDVSGKQITILNKQKLNQIRNSK